jgi:hypothetical protein
VVGKNSTRSSSFRRITGSAVSAARKQLRRHNVYFQDDRITFSAWESGNAGRPELKQNAIELYRKLTDIIRSDVLAKERLEFLEGLIEN